MTKNFIQWKGTDVCIDVHCDCGCSFHFDGYFAYELTCPSCKQTYELGTSVSLTPCEAALVVKEGIE